jgi:hypothetical protein
MGSSQNKDAKDLVEERSSSRALHGFETRQTLNTIITNHTAKRWIQGCHLLAFSQDIILMNGPAAFVGTCLDSNAPKKEMRGLIEFHQANVQKLLLSILFTILAPFFLPVFAVTQFMPHDFAFSRVGDARLAWSKEHGFFKIFQDSNDFIAENVRFDLGRLREELVNGTTETSGDVLYLRDQEIQAQLSLMYVQICVGSLTLAIAFLVYFIRTTNQNSKYVKWFVIHVLHFQWFGVKFPRLKFTSSTIFWGRIELYKLVPCVWFSIMASFVLVVPMCVFQFEKQDVLQVERWNLMARTIPACVIAAYTIGTLYLQAASSTFLWWLSTPLEYALNDRLFEMQSGGLFVQIANRMDYCTITVAEVEGMASMRSAELWFNCSLFRLSTNQEVTDATIEDIDEVEKCMRNGQWQKANSKLQLWQRDIASHQKFAQIRRDAAAARMIKHIHIVDTASDASFWVDVPKEECTYQTPDGLSVWNPLSDGIEHAKGKLEHAKGRLDQFGHKLII